MGRRRHRGASLLELVITVAIIGVIASVAVPEKTPTEVYGLSTATASLTDILEFTRERAVYTGVSHGVEVDAVEQQVRVFRVDSSSNPATLVFDVYDPVSKQPYALRFSQGELSAVALIGLRASMSSSCDNSTTFAFDRTGVIRCALDATRRFDKLIIDYEANGRTETLQIDPYIGRLYVP